MQMDKPKYYYTPSIEEGEPQFLVIPFLPDDSYCAYWENKGMNPTAWAVWIDLATKEVTICNEGEQVDCNLSRSEFEYVQPIMSSLGYLIAVFKVGSGYVSSKESGHEGD
jgi:hypothetical protein